MVARSPPPSLRWGWLQFEFFLAGQAGHWSLNRLPWQITMHSCPPTVEIKLCPVSASSVFSSLCLGPSPTPSTRILLFLKLLRPDKGATWEEACGGWVIMPETNLISPFTVNLVHIPPGRKTRFLLQMNSSAYELQLVQKCKEWKQSLSEGSWTASACTCGPVLVCCVFVAEVVCVMVKEKGKHFSPSSDVWTCCCGPSKACKAAGPAGCKKPKSHCRHAGESQQADWLYTHRLVNKTTTLTTA